VGGKRVEHSFKVNYVRYADDFVITGESKELLENRVKPLVREFLKARGLELSEEKTRITHVDEGFDFLGWNVRKFKGKLLIRPSKDNVKAFLRKVRNIIGANKTAKQASLIIMLNPVLRGWANYHRHAVSSETFSKVGYAIWRKLWRWARRRHSDKEGTRSWVFAASERVKGRMVIYRLYAVNRTKIVRHVRIREEANPFDPRWERYFEQRSLSKLLHGAKGRDVELRMLKKQGGKCPICQQMLGENHRAYPAVAGRAVGGDEPDTPRLVLMHTTCHRQADSRWKSVARPVAG
jgi:RNA-directed DNA polymerase